MRPISRGTKHKQIGKESGHAGRSDDERGEETLRISIEILKKFIADPYACEPMGAIAIVWIKIADISLVQGALDNLVQCGLLSMFGDGPEPVYFCRNVALLEAVVELLDGTAAQPRS